MGKNTLKILLAGMLVAPTAVWAATATGTLSVGADISSSCAVSTTAVNFTTDALTLATTAATANGAIKVTCSSGTSYTIGLDKGANGSSVTAREMKDSAGDTLGYALYYDSSLSNNWGETAGTDTPAAATGDGTEQSVTVYGQIPVTSGVKPASDYADTVNVTVTY